MELQRSGRENGWEMLGMECFEMTVAEMMRTV